MLRNGFCFIVFILVVTGCGNNNDVANRVVDKNALFVMLKPEETGVSFVNEIESQKEFNIFKYRNFYNGGGVAIGDINNDGLPDIFFTANMKENKLFLNKGNFRFEDITSAAGVGGRKPWDTGVVMADVNADGLLDIYVCTAGNDEGDNHNNELYINNGDLTFTERAAEFNLAKSGFSIHASFFDYDKDGDLDAYILNNSNIPVSTLGYAADRDKRASDWENVPEKFRGIGDVLLRNDNGKFVDVSEEAGIYGSLIGFGLGVMVSDVNGDTYPDIYITNDFYERDYLYINQKDGTFKEEIKNWTTHLSLTAMGVDIADISNDGLHDIFVTDMLPESNVRTKSITEFENNEVFKLKQSRDFYQQYIQNTLQINNGNNSFSETAHFSGVASTDWSWAALIFDMDNDGYKDIFVSNGIVRDLTDIDFVDFLADQLIRRTLMTGEKDEVTSIINAMPSTPLSNYAFRNKGDLTFENASTPWGLDMPSFSNGCAYADLDLDGDLDLVVNNVNMEAFIFRNNSREIAGNNYLQFQLQGSEKNPFAVGSTVKLFMDSSVLIQELMPSRGFQSSVDHVFTFGIGKASEIDSVSILWPDGRLTVLDGVKANQRIKASHADATMTFKPQTKKNARQFFTEVDTKNIEVHAEDLYDDFDQEGLVGLQLSKEGPALAVGDVNKDGNEDMFLGGGKGQPGRVYLNNGNGNLKLKESECFLIDLNYEDTTAEFFDADGDGDLDLIVGSGGNITTDKDSYRARLYLNDGSGGYSASQELPSLKTNISVIAPFDFDDDGDIDLFIGSRSVPGVYGVDPRHLFLQNNGSGVFADVTERYAYDLKDAGMVTDGVWIDVDGDDKKDLVTVSDWGSPTVLRNSGKRLTKWPTSLDSLRGWWKTIEAADVDNDGDLDLILGNTGTNTPYRGSVDHPMKLWINDFDRNGTIEQIMTVNEDGGDYPIHMRKEITSQMPVLKKQNLKASDYAKRVIDELFTETVVRNSLIKEVNTCESVIAFNDGDGKFSVVPLPSRVQWSSVYGITTADVNADGNTDVIMAGNFYGLKPQFSRQDASFGHVLLGDGSRHFKWANFEESGFFLRDEVRNIKFMSDKKGQRYLVASVNSGAPRLFKLNARKK